MTMIIDNRTTYVYNCIYKYIHIRTHYNCICLYNCIYIDTFGHYSHCEFLSLEQKINSVKGPGETAQSVHQGYSGGFQSESLEVSTDL